MKKLIIPAALAAFALSPIAVAQTATGDTYRPDLRTGEGNAFIAGTVGKADGSASNFGSGDFNFRGSGRSSTGYGLVGGYRWKVGPAWGLGVEAGYTDLGNLVIRNAIESGDVDQREARDALRGWQLGANARVNINPAWYVGMRGGLFRANDNETDYYHTADEVLRLRNRGRNSWYAGVGTGWNVNDNFSVGVHYDYYRAKAGEVSDPDTGTTFDGPKRSTALLGLTAEYAF